MQTPDSVSFTVGGPIQNALYFIKVESEQERSIFSRRCYFDLFSLKWHSLLYDLHDECFPDACVLVYIKAFAMLISFTIDCGLCFVEKNPCSSENHKSAGVERERERDRDRDRERERERERERKRERERERARQGFMSWS